MRKPDAYSAFARDENDEQGLPLPYEISTSQAKNRIANLLAAVNVKKKYNVQLIDKPITKSSVGKKAPILMQRNAR